MYSLNVENMVSCRGNTVPNQFNITCVNGMVFQSYTSMIAIKMNGNRYINSMFYKYSNTTTKYTVVFFNCYDSKELHAFVKDGSIKLVSNSEFQKLLIQVQS